MTVETSKPPRTHAMPGVSTVLEAPRCSGRDLTLAQAAHGILTAHIGRRVSLDRVAESCGVTTFHLIRVFRRVTGFSPYAYLMVLRVNEARRLLDAGASISDAVHSCGFSDQSHLTRVFKRTLGLPPGQYVRAIASVGDVPGGRAERRARRVSPHATYRPCCDCCDCCD
jgi:AraC-like DNA-binding protein